MSVLLFLAAIMYLRVAYFMAVQIANSAIVVAIATLAARAFASTTTAVHKMVLFVHLAVSTILRQLSLALLTAVALLVQAIWIAAFHATRYALATSAARFMVATASTAIRKVLTAMSSIALSIPIFDEANGHITAWRLVHLRVGIQLETTDIATPSKQSMRIGVDDTSMLTPSTTTIENQLATTIKAKTKTAPAPTISPTIPTSTPTTLPLALTANTDDTLGVHVDASNNSAVGVGATPAQAQAVVARWMANTIYPQLPIVGSYKPVASRQLAIALRSIVHPAVLTVSTVPALPPCSSALSLVWHSTSTSTSTAPADVPQTTITIPHTVSQALVSKRIECECEVVDLFDLFGLFDLAANQASNKNEKVVHLIQAIGFKDDSVDNDDDEDMSDDTSDETSSSSTAEPESELESESKSKQPTVLDLDLQPLGIEDQETAQQAEQQQEHQDHQDEDHGEDHSPEASPVTVAAPSASGHHSSIDAPLDDKPTKTSWLLKLLCSGQSASAKPSANNTHKQRHATPVTAPAPRFSNNKSGSTSSNRFGMDWFLSPQAQRIYKQ